MAQPLSNLSTLLLDSPELLFQDDGRMRNASLHAAKHLFDQGLRSEAQDLASINDLLKEISPSRAPITRSQMKKASETPSQPILLQQTPLTSLHIDGLDEQQIWGQLDLRTKGLCSILSSIMSGSGGPSRSGLEEENEEDEEMGDLDMDEDESLEDDDELAEWASESEESDEDSDSSSSDEPSPMEESDEEMLLQDEGPTILDDGSRRSKQKKSPRSPLDDGFFSLSEFNAETEGHESRKSSKGRLDDEDEDEDEESIDLFTTMNDETSAGFEEEDVENADSGQAMYADFFSPPTKTSVSRGGNSPSKARSGKVKFNDKVRVKLIDANNEGRSAKEFKGLSLSELWDDGDIVDDEENDDSDQSESESDEESLEAPREVIGRFKDDLFEDDESEQHNDVSGHEARLAALANQISQLESENVGEKDWTLLGEATSRKRPHNSLLEEDLEFEHVQRPVSATSTSQITNLEALIKQRIIEKRFDDVEKRRPVNERPFLPSSVFELDDAKAKQSLAQIYESDYVAAKDGTALPEKDTKLQKEHDDLEATWDRICSKLDALSNSHFTPKATKAVISSISNVASATLESALPTTTSTGTQLAPEEVFTPKASDNQARSEMTPSEKRAQRARERKARKKVQMRLSRTSAQSKESGRPSKRTKEEKDDALRQLLKSSQSQGVAVRTGEKAEKEKVAKSTGGVFRL